MNSLVGKVIEKHATGKKVLILFLVTQVIYAIMVFGTIPKVMSYADDMDLLDMMPMGYDYHYVSILMASLGPTGREVYKTQQIPLDMVYPLLFMITYFLLLAFFLKRVIRVESKLYYLCFLPVIGGFFDYLENFGIISIINSYPDISELSVQLTAFFSRVKSYSTIVYFTVLIISIVAFFIKKSRTRQQPSG